MPGKTAHSLAEEARRRRLWLYDPQYKRWYSPDDFVKSFGQSMQNHDSYFDSIQIKDPIEAILQGQKAIKDLQNKVHALTERVLEHLARSK